MVEQAVADKMHEVVLVHAGLVVLEQIGVLLDEADDIVDPLLGRLEAAPAAGVHQELVAGDLAAVAADAHIGGVFQPVPAVVLVTGVLQQVLDVDALEEVVVSEFVFHSFPFMCLS